MSAFPRLASQFGAAVDDLDAAAIRRAVGSRIHEDEQLDWKVEPYESNQGLEIAKDVASFANHLGGVIVIGVAEDAHGAAARTQPFADSVDKLERQIREACNARVRPFVPVAIYPVPDATTNRWFLVVVVPKSRDAPHSIIGGKREAPTMAFPIRDGRATRWMSEAELGPRYRDRYSSRVDLDGRLRTLLADGMRHTDDAYTWLSVACVPTEPGRRPPGSAARAAELGLMTSWIYSGPPATPFQSANVQNPRIAVGRTVFSDQSTQSRTSRRVHVELGHDGSGMCARILSSCNNVSTSAVADDAGSARWLGSDSVEWDCSAACSFWLTTPSPRARAVKWSLSPNYTTAIWRVLSGCVSST